MLLQLHSTWPGPLTVISRSFVTRKDERQASWAPDCWGQPWRCSDPTVLSNWKHAKQKHFVESWQTTWLFWSKRAWIYTMMRILGIRVHKPMTLMFYFPSGQGLWPTVFQSSQPTSPNIRHPGFIQKSALVVRVAEAHGWVFWDLSQTANEMEKKEWRFFRPIEADQTANKHARCLETCYGQKGGSRGQPPEQQGEIPKFIKNLSPEILSPRLMLQGQGCKKSVWLKGVPLSSIN